MRTRPWARPAGTAILDSREAHARGVRPFCRGSGSRRSRRRGTRTFEHRPLVRFRGRQHARHRPTFCNRSGRSGRMHARRCREWPGSHHGLRTGELLTELQAALAQRRKLRHAFIHVRCGLRCAARGCDRLKRALRVRQGRCRPPRGREQRTDAARHGGRPDKASRRGLP